MIQNRNCSLCFEGWLVRGCAQGVVGGKGWGGKSERGERGFSGEGGEGAVGEGER